MTKRINNHGVTPIIATVLLLAMTIGLFSVLNVMVFSFPISPRSPAVSLVASVEYNNRTNNGYNGQPVSIIIEHKGGDALYKNDIQIDIMVFPDNNNSFKDITGHFSDDSDDELFSIGDYWIYDSGFYVKDREIYAIVAHLPTNSVLMMGTIQEGDQI